MDLKELFQLDMSRTATLPFSASWSNDDRISVIAENGVHILKFCPDVASLNTNSSFRRSWFKVDYVKMDTGIDIASILYNLEQEATYELILDITLSPELPTSKPVRVAVTQASWSPGNMFQNIRCLLAVVTNYGTVQLYTDQLMEWYVADDISLKWLETCKANWKGVKELSPAEKFNVLKTRVSQLKALCVTWSSLLCYESQHYSYLLVGYKNGNVTAWKVTLGVSDTSPNSDIDFVINTNLKRISCIYWFDSKDNEALLFIGTSLGNICCYKIVKKDDKLKTVSEISLWPSADNIPVSWMECFPKGESDSFITMVAIKGTFVVLISMTKDGTITSTSARQIGNLSINGIGIIDKTSAILCTHNGHMKKIIITRDNYGDTKLTLEPVSVKSASHWRPIGLALSLSKAICIVVYRIADMYDHLIRRDAIRTIFYRYKGIPDMISSLMANPSQKLTFMWDHLEAIRLQAISSETEPNFDDVIFKTNLESSSSYHVRVILALTRIVLAQNDQSDITDRVKQLQMNLKDVKMLLFVRHACETIQQLYCNWKGRGSLNSYDLCSLGLMRLWLRSVNMGNEHDESMRNPMQVMMEESINLPTIPGEAHSETCNICKAEIQVVSNLQINCRAGHLIPRCSQSMLQCTEFPSAFCRVCGAIVHPQVMLKNPGTLCIFCDSTLEVDKRILSTGNSNIRNSGESDIQSNEQRNVENTEKSNDEIMEESNIQQPEIAEPVFISVKSEL